MQSQVPLPLRTRFTDCLPAMYARLMHRDAFCAPPHTEFCAITGHLELWCLDAPPDSAPLSGTQRNSLVVALLQGAYILIDTCYQ